MAGRICGQNSAAELTETGALYSHVRPFEAKTRQNGATFRRDVMKMRRLGRKWSAKYRRFGLGCMGMTPHLRNARPTPR